MSYRTKIRVADSYDVFDIVGGELTPYISNVVLSEATSNENKLQIGTAVAGQLNLDLHNSPVQLLDGIKIELYVMEEDDVSRAQIGQAVDPIELELNVDENTTLEDLTDETGIDPPIVDPVTEAEKEVFNLQWDLTDVTDINESPEAQSLIINEDDETGLSSHEDGENTNYREDSAEAGVVAMTDPVEGELDRWIQMGVFYVASTSEFDDYLSLTCLDGFVLMNGKFEPTEQTQKIADHYLEFIAQCEELEIEAEEVENFPDIEVAWVDSTMRQAAGYFASFVGAYATFNRGGGLEFRQYLQNEDYSIDPINVKEFNRTLTGGINIDSALCHIVLNGAVSIITPVDAEAGANTVICTNPMMTPEILESILEVYQFLVYQPCRIVADWRMDYQCGDIITVDLDDESYSVCLTNITINFTEGLCTIESRGGADTDARFISPIMKQIIESGKTATNYITQDETGALVISNDVTQGNVRIDFDSVDIRDGEEVKASFGEWIIMGNLYEQGLAISEDALMWIVNGNERMRIQPQEDGEMRLSLAGNVWVNYNPNDGYEGTKLGTHGGLDLSPITHAQIDTITG